MINPFIWGVQHTLPAGQTKTWVWLFSVSRGSAALMTVGFHLFPVPVTTLSKKKK